MKIEKFEKNNVAAVSINDRDSDVIANSDSEKTKSEEKSPYQITGSVGMLGVCIPAGLEARYGRVSVGDTTVDGFSTTFLGIAGTGFVFANNDDNYFEAEASGHLAVLAFPLARYPSVGVNGSLQAGRFHDDFFVGGKISGEYGVYPILGKGTYSAGIFAGWHDSVNNPVSDEGFNSGDILVGPTISYQKDELWTDSKYGVWGATETIVNSSGVQAGVESVLYLTNKHGGGLRLKNEVSTQALTLGSDATHTVPLKASLTVDRYVDFGGVGVYTEASKYKSMESEQSDVTEVSAGIRFWTATL